MELSKWRPPYAYVPGQNPRHAEDLFDPIKKDVVEGMSSEAIRSSVAWAQGLVFLKEGYYWESHEVLEAIWLQCPSNTAERLIVQCLIQLANAGLKKKMQRSNAFDRLIRIADDLFAESLVCDAQNKLGFNSLDYANLREKVANF